MRGVVLLAAGVLAAIALVVFTPVVVEDWSIRAPVLAAAIGGIALLNWFDSRRELRRGHERAQLPEALLPSFSGPLLLLRLLWPVLKFWF